MIIPVVWSPMMYSSGGHDRVLADDNAQQHGRPDRTDRRNLTEPFPDLVLLALRQ